MDNKISFIGNAVSDTPKCKPFPTTTSLHFPSQLWDESDDNRVDKQSSVTWRYLLSENNKKIENKKEKCAPASLF